MSETDRLFAEIVRRAEPLLRAHWTSSGLQGSYVDYRQEVWCQTLRAPASDVPLTTHLRLVAISVGRNFRRESEEEAQTIELETQVQGGLTGDLPDRERKIMEMLVRKTSSGEIARQLGVSVGAVRMAKARAMARMRELLHRDAAPPQEE